jgi:citrate lyase synthetase
MLLTKPKDTRFHKQRLKSNLSFLQLSLVDQFMRLMEGSITGMKDCSWSINCSAVAAKIMICRAEDVRNFCSAA